MRRSLLALLRTPDARSLGWALSALLALNVFVAGLHLGFASATSRGAVLCSAEQPGNGGVPSPATHDQPCCLAGCMTPALGLASPPAEIARALPILLAMQVPAADAPMAIRQERANAPRGPPVLA
jgi:hypothetical protein